MDIHQLALTNLLLVFLLKLTCFVLGYLVVRLGYKLLVAGVKGEFKFQADLKGMRADLASASPGLLFLLLGVFLIGYAIYVPKVTELEQLPAETAPPPNVALPPLETPPRFPASPEPTHQTSDGDAR